MTVPAPLLLLGVVLALVAVIALWKLLVTAGLIGLAQWAVITQTDSPTAVLVVIGVPALVTAFTLSRLMSRSGSGHGMRPALLSRPTRVEVSR